MSGPQKIEATPQRPPIDLARGGREAAAWRTREEVGTLALQTDHVAATRQRLADLTDPEQMSPDERLQEIGWLLARGRDRARQQREPVQGRASMLTVAACVRRFCLECLGATSGRNAFDCLSRICLLYAACPFWHKPMPVTMRPPDYDGEPDIPRPKRRRPSRSPIRAYCRTCQPGDRTDCQGSACALYPYRPWPGPGHAPKPERTAKQRAAAAARGLALAAQKAKNLRTEGQYVARTGAHD